MLANTLTGVVFAELPVPRLMIKRKLNRPEEFELSVPYNLVRRHPHVDDIEIALTRTNIEPVATSAYIFRDGVALGGGIIWGARLWSQDHRVVLTGEGFMSYFHRRFLKIDKDYNNVDVLSIPQDLINYAQGIPGGDIAVEVGTETSGENMSRTYRGYNLQPIGYLIERLSEWQSPRGYDFDINLEVQTDGSVERHFNLWYPRRGRRTGIVFELQRNIHRIQNQIEGGQKANSIIAIGAGEGDDMLQVTRTDANDFSIYPLVEHKVSHKDVSVEATLLEHAEHELSERKTTPEFPDLSVVTTAPGGKPGTLALGDSIYLNAVDGLLDVQGYFRVLGWELRVETGGAETYKLELGFE